MLAECRGCGTRFAPDLERCPHCGLERAEEDGMPKIVKGTGPTFPEDAVPAEDGPDAEVQGADAPDDAAAEPQAPDAAPEPAPAPPRVPPRLAPPEVPGA